MALQQRGARALAHEVAARIPLVYAVQMLVTLTVGIADMAVARWNFGSVNAAGLIIASLLATPYSLGSHPYDVAPRSFSGLARGFLGDFAIGAKTALAAV